ncbi:MAG: HlyD family efflux transporter periplasmic adaptor subunit [Alphaproteobacteria bacterium]|nr:HlyD family efflux transporter periplasmic adaptor subunit [Alphaproteobacteria bacterium]
MRIWIKRLGLLALVLVIGAGFYLAMREQPVPVDIATVTAGPMTVTIDEEGVTRVKDVYAVSSPIAGHLDRTTLDEGEPVKANETVIASIHPLDPPFLDQRTRAELTAAAEAARSAVALAKVELQRARTAHELASSNYERAAKLEKTNTISISQLERAYSEMQLEKAQIDATEATIRLREAELASAEARLQQPTSDGARQADQDCCVSIVAPIDGVILKVLARSEQAVSPGTLIAEIGDPENLEIVVDLLSSDAAKIRAGANVRITDWGGSSDLQGIVRRIEPAAFTKVSSLGIEEQRVNIVIDPLTVPPALGHGYRVLAHIRTWENDHALQAPISALFRSNGEWSVFMVESDRAVLRRITIGQMSDSHAEVLDGLSDATSVVLYPNDVLKDGSLVEMRSTSP